MEVVQLPLKGNPWTSNATTDGKFHEHLVYTGFLGFFKSEFTTFQWLSHGFPMALDCHFGGFNWFVGGHDGP